jgi:hypothetical protein
MEVTSSAGAVMGPCFKSDRAASRDPDMSWPPPESLTPYTRAGHGRVSPSGREMSNDWSWLPSEPSQANPGHAKQGERRWLGNRDHVDVGVGPIGRE